VLLAVQLKSKVKSMIKVAVTITNEGVNAQLPKTPIAVSLFGEDTLRIATFTKTQPTKDWGGDFFMIDMKATG
jgi:hypothetical protein